MKIRFVNVGIVGLYLLVAVCKESAPHVTPSPRTLVNFSKVTYIVCSIPITHKESDRKTSLLSPDIIFTKQPPSPTVQNPRLIGKCQNNGLIPSLGNTVH